MSELQAHGIGVVLPVGWEGEIYRRPDPPEAELTTRRSQAWSQIGGEATRHTVVHLASFPLPPRRGDYGSGAVEIMRPTDVFIVLFEYHPDATRTVLFERSGLPLPLRAQDFDPAMMQRPIAGQAGLQRFFSAADRAFCLYVVLGSYRHRGTLTDTANGILAGVTFG